MFPLCVILGDETRLDGVDITPEEIYKWSDAHKTTPKTAAITFGVVEDAIRAAKEADDEVIFIGISSKMSTTNNVMNMAAQELEYDKLHVFDSRNLSTGIGLQVLYAARLAEEGKSAAQILDSVGKKYRGKLQAVLVKYAKDLEQDLLKADPTIVFITHSGCSKEEEQAVYDYLVSLNHFKEVCITRAGGVISSHCGPGTLGVLFYSK